MAATRRVLDFKLKYRPEDVDRAAALAADQAAPVFEANRWVWDGGGVPSAAQIALVVRRLLERAVELEFDGEVGTGRITVRRYEEGDVRIYLDLGAIRPSRET